MGIKVVVGSGSTKKKSSSGSSGVSPSSSLVPTPTERSLSMSLPAEIRNLPVQEVTTNQSIQKGITVVDTSSNAKKSGGVSSVSQIVQPTISIVPTPTEQILSQSFPENIRNLPAAEIQSGQSITSGFTFAPIVQNDNRSSIKSQIKDITVFGEPLFLDNFSPNVGGVLRGGFSEFTGIIEENIVSPFISRQQDQGRLLPQSREEFLGSTRLAGFGSFIKEVSLIPKFDAGQFGVDLFFAPGFALESSIPKLAQPRTIFRQSVPEAQTVSATLISPSSKEGVLLSQTETRSFIPARFETRASIAGELFKEFETVQIAPRKSSITFSEVGIDEGGRFLGSAGRKVVSGTRKQPTEIFKLRGQSQEIKITELKSGISPLEQRSFKKIGLDTKKGFVISDDLKAFRGGGEASNIFDVGKEFINLKTPGKRVTRTANVGLFSSVGEEAKLFKTISASSDVSFGVRGRKIDISKGVILDTRKSFKADEFLSGFNVKSSLKTKTKPVQIASSDISRDLTEQFAKLKTPRSTPKINVQIKVDIANIPLVGPGAFEALRLNPSQFAGKGLYEKTDFSSFGSLPKQQKSTNNLFNFQTLDKSINPNKLVSVPKLDNSFSTLNFNIKGLENIGISERLRGGSRFKSSPKLGLDIKQTQLSPPETVTPLIPRFVSDPEFTPQPTKFPPDFNFGSSSSLKKRAFIPFIPGLGFDDFGKRTRTSSRKLARQPSLIAAVLDIRAPKMATYEETGLVIRPLLE